MLERAADATVEVVEVGCLNALTIGGIEHHQARLDSPRRLQIEKVRDLHPHQVLQPGGADTLAGIAHRVFVPIRSQNRRPVDALLTGCFGDLSLIHI